MQELIEDMTEMLIKGEIDIYALKEKARELLEQEKEMVCNAWIDGKSGSYTDPLDYYNITFF